MSKVVRLNDESIRLLEDYRKSVIDQGQKLGMKTHVEIFSALDYNDLIKFVVSDWKRYFDNNK